MKRIAIILMVSSCSFNEMPPVHNLYNDLSAKEQRVYNSLNAKERANVNKNKYIHQLRQAIDDASYDVNTNKIRLLVDNINVNK